jgi:UDP-glucose 4-epimerase
MGATMIASDNLVKQSIWVTGARGFIGRHLASSLAAAGHAVAGLGFGAWPEAVAADWGVSAWVEGSVDAPHLAALAKVAPAPDVIYHLAGGASVARAASAPLEDFQRTVGSTAQLLEWVRLHRPGRRVVLVSSAAVYGDLHAGPIVETAAVGPVSIYGEHKLMMEQLGRYHAREFGTDIVIARIFSVYGPHLMKQLIWDICRRVEAGESPLRLGGTGDELRDFCEVRDAARALAGLARGPVPPVVNIGTGFGTRVADIAALVVGNCAVQPPVVFSGETRAGDPHSLVADATVLAATGFRPAVSLAEGLRDTVTWYRQRGAQR